MLLLFGMVGTARIVTYRTDEKIKGVESKWFRLRLFDAQPTYRAVQTEVASLEPGKAKKGNSHEAC